MQSGCITIQISYVTVQSDRDLQLYAELYFSLTAEMRGAANLCIILGGRDITKIKNPWRKELCDFCLLFF
jgi:hypothetical protein